MTRAARCVILVVIGAVALVGQARAAVKVTPLGHYRAVPHPTRRVVLVSPDGTPVGGQWQRWADESEAPTYGQRVVFGLLDCGGPEACSVGSATTRGPYLVFTGPPFQMTATATGSHTIDRDNLYFELGHVFDWAYLTATDRRYLARGWGLPHWHWWDTVAALARNGEDGLEAIFSGIYQDCANGVDDRHASVGLFEPPGVSSPNAMPTIDTCAFIRRVSRRGPEVPTANDTEQIQNRP